MEQKKNSHQEKLEITLKKFFGIIASDPTMAFLVEPDDQFGTVLYKVLRGPKSQQKVSILNNVMRLYVSKTLFRKDGKPYQPNGVMTRLKSLFGEFARNGIEMSLTKDFRGSKNSFTKWMEGFWHQKQKKDAKFGCRPTKPALPDNYDTIIYREVVVNKKMAYDGSNINDLLALFAMKLGTMFGFRGVQVRTKSRYVCCN